MPIPKLKTFKFGTKLLDKELFKNLLSIYAVGVFRGNMQRGARFLGVTTPTITRWYRKEQYPPDLQYYWTTTLKVAIEDAVVLMRTSSNKQLKIQANRVMRDLGAIYSYEEVKTLEAKQPDGAAEFLLSLFKDRPIHTTDYILSAANTSKYSKQVLRHARNHLNLDHWSEGFGEDKTTYWGLPTTKEDNNE